MEHIKIMLFSDKWSMRDESKFIDHLAWFTRTEKKRITKSDREIFMFAWINTKKLSNGKETIMPLPVYTLTDCYRRFDLAEQRYETWKGIISYKGVKYNVAGNTIRATDKTMAEICEMYQYGRAYIFESEYKWNELQVIFGPYRSGNHGRTQGGGYSQLLEEMLSELARKPSIHEDVEAADTDDSGPDQQPVGPPDLFSTTKGKGHVINKPEEIPVAPGVRIRQPQVKSKNVKQSPSSSAKRFLDF